MDQFPTWRGIRQPSIAATFQQYLNCDFYRSILLAASRSVCQYVSMSVCLSGGPLSQSIKSNSIQIQIQIFKLKLKLNQPIQFKFKSLNSN